MPENAKYMVHAEGARAELAIEGRASYLNCMNLPAFFEKIVSEGCRNLLIDCKNCQSMDSTVLGIIAGIALKFRHLNPPGEILLLNPNARVLELIKNLGLHKIIKIDSSDKNIIKPQTEVPHEAASTERILEAHENLVEADAQNESKFQDVIRFLKAEGLEN